jgi:hypothetical protein
MACSDNCNQCSQYPCTCACNFWITASGVNQLKGCICDPKNPIRLQDCFIVDALQRSIKACKDFDLLWPSLFPCEKERFETLFRDNPRYRKMWACTSKYEDTFQRRMNNIPVRTVGKNGGLRQYRQMSVRLPPHLQPKVQPPKCPGWEKK